MDTDQKSLPCPRGGQEGWEPLSPCSLLPVPLFYQELLYTKKWEGKTKRNMN